MEKAKNPLLMLAVALVVLYVGAGIAKLLGVPYGDILRFAMYGAAL
jgi:hypothetical protein